MGENDVIRCCGFNQIKNISAVLTLRSHVLKENLQLKAASWFK